MMRKLVAALLCIIMLMSLSLLPNGVGAQQTQRKISSGGWAQEWAGGFGVIYDLQLSPTENKLFVAGSSVIHRINLSTYVVERQLMGHNGRIYSIALSPDGSKLASASIDFTVKVWKTGTGDLVKSFLVSNSSIAVSVAYSPKGRKIATGADDTHLKLWDVESGELLWDVKAHDDGVTCIDFSPDGTLIATGSGFSGYRLPGGGRESYDTTIKLWNSSSGELIRTLKGHEDGILQVKFSPNGKLLASASRDSNITIWDVEEGSAVSVLEGHTDDVNDVRWSADGKELVSCSNDRTIKIWDVVGKKVIEEWEDDRNVNAVEWLSKKTIVSGNQRCKLKFWVRGSKDPIQELGEHSRRVISLDVSPAGDKIVSGSRDNTIRVWNAESGESFILGQHDDWVNCVAWSPDGKWIASGGDRYDATVKIWEVKTKKLYKSFSPTGAESGPAVYDVSWSPDSKKVVAGYQDSNIRIWDISSGLEQTLYGHHQRVFGVDWSPRGDKIVSGDYSRAQNTKIWEWDEDLERWSCTLTFTAHDDGIECVRWSNDGTQFITTAWKSIKVWNEDGVFICSLGPFGYLVNDVRWSSNDAYVVSGAKTLDVWSLATGEWVASLKGHDSGRGCYPYISGVGWLSGDKIASCSGDRTVRVWAPCLEISVNLSTQMLSEEEITVDIQTSYKGEPVSGATIEIGTDAGVFSRSTGATNITGAFTTTFYAPPVEHNTSCTITIVASKPGSGYGDGKLVFSAIIYPKNFLIDVDAPSKLNSSECSIITVKVSNRIGAVEGAEVAFSSTQGILTPSANVTSEEGVVAIEFKAPKTYHKKTCTLTITVTKEGYPTAQKLLRLQITPEEKPRGFIPGFEFFGLLVALALAFLGRNAISSDRARS